MALPTAEHPICQREKRKIGQCVATGEQPSQSSQRQPINTPQGPLDGTVTGISKLLLLTCVSSRRGNVDTAGGKAVYPCRPIHQITSVPLGKSAKVARCTLWASSGMLPAQASKADCVLRSFQDKCQLFPSTFMPPDAIDGHFPRCRKYLWHAPSMSTRVP